MHYEEKLEIAFSLRNRSRGGEFDKSLLNVYEKMQSEVYLAGVRVFRIEPQESGLHPLVINFHGGGFIKPRQDKDQYFCSRLSKELGVCVFDVDYPLAPEHPFPEAVDSICDLYEYVLRHADALGIDKQRIVLVGHSAGGNLATVLCIYLARKKLPQPKALVVEYAPFDLLTDPALKDRCLEDMSAAIARTYNELYVQLENASSSLCSPLYASDDELSSFPPTLVIYAGKDSLGNEAVQFAHRLIQNSITTTVRCFRNSHHGFTINCNDEWEDAVKLIYRHIYNNI